MPQAKKAYYKSTKGVSLNTFMGLFLICAIWIWHGKFTGQPLLSISHIIAGCFYFIIVFSIARDRKDFKIILYTIVITGAILTLFLLSSNSFRVAILLSLTLFLRFPQLYKAGFSSNIDGISVPTWMLATVSNAHWLGAGILKHDLGLIIPGSSNVIFSILIIIIVVARRKKIKNDNVSNEIYPVVDL